jgi:hypothetical protein
LIIFIGKTFVNLFLAIFVPPAKSPSYHGVRNSEILVHMAMISNPYDSLYAKALIEIPYGEPF